MHEMNAQHGQRDPDPRRQGVRRTVWICVIVVVVLLSLFWAEHIWQ